MAGVVTQIKQALFDLAREKHLVDPITQVAPTSERALGTLFSVYAQRQAIRWGAIPLYDPESRERVANASTIISGPGAFTAEYLLLHHNGAEEQIWGGMSADLLYLAHDLSTLVMFEIKVGSDFTYESTAASSQLARQLDYLRGAPIPDIITRRLVLLTGRQFIDHGWYYKELTEALKYDKRSARVTGFLMHWEDVMNALTV